MSGENDLDKLLPAMSPVLMAGEFVFLSFEASQYGDHSDLEPVASMVEAEGLSLVVPRSKADERGLKYQSVYRYPY